MEYKKYLPWALLAIVVIILAYYVLAPGAITEEPTAKFHIVGPSNYIKLQTEDAAGAEYDLNDVSITPTPGTDYLFDENGLIYVGVYWQNLASTAGLDTFLLKINSQFDSNLVVDSITTTTYIDSDWRITAGEWNLLLNYDPAGGWNQDIKVATVALKMINDPGFGDSLPVSFSFDAGDSNEGRLDILSTDAFVDLITCDDTQQTSGRYYCRDDYT